MVGRRVLLVAHHFPPSGGSGPNRALAMATFLREHGWEPTVLTVDSAWAMMPDAALAAELPGDVRVVRTRSLEPRPAQPGPTPRTRARPSPVRPTTAGLRSHLGHLKRFPDAHAGWIPFATAAALRERYDVVYSTSGPFSSHVVGLLVKLVRRTPWVAELRDGWYVWNRSIFPDYPGWRGGLERRLESRALHTADRVVLVTERMAETFRRQYPDLPATHFAVVSNGYNPLQTSETAPLRAPAARQPVVLVHAGALYYGRSVAALLAAVRESLASASDQSGGVRLDLLGTLDAAARAEVTAAGLDQHVRVLGPVDHASALAAMRQAHLLVLVANATPGAEATVPGKLFEYLVSGRPILALAPRPSSTRDVLEHTGGGYLALPDDPTSVATALRQAVDDLRHGRARTADPAAVATYDRRRLAGEMAAVLDGVVTSGANARRI